MATKLEFLPGVYTSQELSYALGKNVSGCATRMIRPLQPCCPKQSELDVARWISWRWLLLHNAFRFGDTMRHLKCRFETVIVGLSPKRGHALHLAAVRVLIAHCTFMHGACMQIHITILSEFKARFLQ